MKINRQALNFSYLKPLLLLAIFACTHIWDMPVGTASPTRSYKVVLSYDIFLAGFLAGTVDLNAKISDGKYHITSISRSHGLLDFLIELRRRNEVIGRIVAGKARPKSYDTTGKWAGKDRSVHIEYGGRDDSISIVRFLTRPSAHEDEREVVPSDLLPGTIDPFSALYEAVLRNETEGSCDGTAEVFDGRRRYDFQFQSIGTVAVGAAIDKTGAVAVPSGLAHVCRVRQNLLAGASKRKWLPRLVRPDWTDIWLAKIRADLPALPLRLEADAGMGAMVARLVAIGGRKYPPDEGSNMEASDDNANERPSDRQ